MKKKTMDPVERFLALPEGAKKAEVAPFDREDMGGMKPRPLTPAQRRRWSLAKRRRGRPKVGEGSTVVPMSLERGLLKEVNAYAKTYHLKRSQMVAEGLRLVMRRRAS